jgi:hypothetical protein
MHRRIFLAAVLSGLLCHPAIAAANKKFVFKIRTKSGGIVGNVLIEAGDVFAAINKLKKRYPGCEVLEVKER